MYICIYGTTNTWRPSEQTNEHYTSTRYIIQHLYDVLLLYVVERFLTLLGDFFFL